MKTHEDTAPGAVGYTGETGTGIIQKVKKKKLYQPSSNLPSASADKLPGSGFYCKCEGGRTWMVRGDKEGLMQTAGTDMRQESVSQLLVVCGGIAGSCHLAF